MSQGFLVTLPNRLFTVAGIPANGWKVYTYAAGLSTPLQTWSDAGLTSSNTNPIITDTDGYFRMFVAQGTRVKIDVRNELDVSQYTMDNLEPMIPDPSAGNVTAVPTGGIIAWGTASAPTGFLLCDGSTVSRATYATLNTLWSAASYPFGNGDGSTTFTLPDFRQRFPIGKAASGTGSTLGGSGGTIDHLHTGPSHTHTVAGHTHTGPSHTHTVAGHTHTITHNHAVTYNGWSTTLNTPPLAGILQAGGTGTGIEASATQATASNTSGASSSADSGSTSLTTDAGGTGATSSTALTTDASGTGNTGTANPPFLAVNWIVKT